MMLPDVNEAVQSGGHYLPGETEGVGTDILGMATHLLRGPPW
ncbi:hypothetical protein [Paenibacillus sp. UNC496MF]|nr:hypothetical protein [Paenibacillus sp. UNC496MF]